MTSLNAVQTQGAIGVQWQSSDGKVTMTTEQLIFQFMYAQCLAKDDVIQMDKDKLAETTKDLTDLATLLGKVESAKVEAEKAKKDGATNVVSEVLSDDEIKQMNALISKLGLTNVFPGVGLLPGAPTVRSMQLQAITQMCNDPDTVNAMYKEAKAAGYVGTAVFVPAHDVVSSQDGGVDSFPDKVTWTPPLSEANKEKIALRCLTTDLASPFKPTVSGTVLSMATLAGAYSGELAAIKEPFVVEGGIGDKMLVRELTYGVTIINSETAAKNTQQQGLLTDTSNDISKKGAFLDGMKSFVDTMTRTRSGTIQQV